MFIIIPPFVNIISLFTQKINICKENEIIYKYEFNDEGQLLLINGDDNFEYKVYYNKIDG